MTNQQHPITPPPELVMQWAHMLEQHTDAEVFNRAARWGADQELEACCEYLTRCAGWMPEDVQEFCDLRRPKPPSLKEQALQALYRFDDTKGHDGLSPEAIADDFDLIRRALEQLDD